jgi:hypothetical protein
VFAAVLAVRATALAARTVLANQSRPSHDGIEVVEGHTRRTVSTDTRDYVFVVTIRNPSAAERRFIEPTLRVTYRTRANFLGAVDLTSRETITVPAGDHATVTLRFGSSNVIPRHCRIDAYTLFFTDEGGGRTTVDASLPSVLQADTDGTGPPTWGWD